MRPRSQTARKSLLTSSAWFTPNHATLARATATMAWLFASWNEIRVVGNLALVDVALIVSFGFLLLDPTMIARSLWNRGFRRPLAAIALIGAAGSVQSAFFGAGFAHAQFVATTIITAGVVATTLRTMTDLHRALRSFLIGCLVSTGFMLGEFNDNVRASGLADHPNTAGFVLALGVVSGWFLLETAETRLARVVFAVASIWVAFGVLLTGSRSAAASVVLIAISVGWSAIRRLNASSTKLGVGVIVLLAGWSSAQALPGVRRSIVGGESVGTSNEGRRDLVSAAWDSIRADPFVGDGFESIRLTHSLPAGLWAGLGLLGLAAAFTIYTDLGLRVLSPRWPSRERVVLSAPALSFSRRSSMVLLVSLTLQTNLADRFLWMVLAGVAAMTSLEGSRAETDSGIDP